MSALSVEGTSLKLPKPFIHIKGDTRAAVLTSSLRSPTIRRKKELCGSTALH